MPWLVGAAAIVAGVTLFGAAVFEQRSAARASSEMSAAEAAAESDGNRIGPPAERAGINAYTALAGSQDAATLRSPPIRARWRPHGPLNSTHPALPVASQLVAQFAMKVWAIWRRGIVGSL